MKNRSGQLALQVLVFASVIVILITGFVFLAVSFLQLSVRSLNTTLAFSIAEGGIEYYRWHLAHAPTDYQDGTGQPGPYTHTYYDKNGEALGEFTLEITPPAGSNVVTIRSTGKIIGDASITKIIEVKLGIPSFAQYAIAANDVMRFGVGTEVFGEIFANGGIRFDGVAHNIVQSAQQTYDDPDHTGANEYGVHTHVAPTDPLPTTTLPARADVFMAGRALSAPALDFAGITQDLADMRTQALAGGVHASSSGALGYDLVLAANDTYTLYRVTALAPLPSGCTDPGNQAGWGTWSIQTETVYATGTIPTNGIFFIEDNLWVRGTVNGQRLNIGAGRFPDNPTTRPSITVNSDLRYTNTDGTDVIGLIAQNNVNVGLVSSDTLRIDAALVAQNGRVGRYYYRPPGSGSQRCSPYHVRQSLTSYGTIITALRYGFAYTDSTGYTTRNLVYDQNLLYAPPPGFPLTGDQYVQISWEEIQ